MSLTIVVDDDGVLRVLHNATVALGRVVKPIADEVAKAARETGGQVTPKLGATWHISGQGMERHVQAPEWWAHFLAGGTKDHGPKSAPSLVFTVAGTTIHASHVRGVTATHFDQKAVDRVKPHVAQIIERVIKEAVT